MGYIKQIILANSAGYPYAKVRIDGHCDIAGGQGAGKTTLMNAILFPFVVDDNLIDITKGEQDRFSEYYFQYPNSFIIYEVMNNKDVPYCVLINRAGPALHFHFISAEFDDAWLFDESGNLRRNWDEVKTRLNGIRTETRITRDEFNRIFLGKGDSYMEQYSIMKSQKGNDTIRPLLSSIFKNLPFTQDNIKTALVESVKTSIESVKTSNQLDSEGINLGHHRMDLAGFQSKLSDINLVTHTGKDGKTAIADVAEAIFRLKDKYETAAFERECIPAKLAFSKMATEKELETIRDELEKAVSRKESMETKHKEEVESLEKELDTVMDALVEVKAGIKAIEELERKYDEKQVSDLDALVEWIRDRKHYEEEKAHIECLMESINNDASEINASRENALKSNKTFYQHKQAEAEMDYNTKDKALSNEKELALDEKEKAQKEIDKKYQSLIGKDWSDSHKQLISNLIETTRRIETCETLADAEKALKELAGVQGEIGKILAEVLSRRCGEGATLNDLKAAGNEALKLLYSHLDEKIKLDKEKASEIAAINDRYSKKKADIESRQISLMSSKKEKIAAIVAECHAKESQINHDYVSQLSSGSGNREEEILDLKDRLESAKYTLQAIADFQGCAVEDKRLIDRKPEFEAKRKELNDRKISIGEKKKFAADSYREAVGEIDGRIQTLTQTKATLESELQAACRFIEQNAHVKAAIETCEPVQIESSPKSIINDYIDINNIINAIKDSDNPDGLPLAVQKLYAPGMLSRVDTFDLGISANSRLSSFDDFMLVADKLEARIKGTENGIGVEEYLKNNATLWLDCLKNVYNDLQPAEDMLMQISRNCNEINRFIQDNNHSTCIDYVRFHVDEESNVTNLVRILREIAKFYEDNQNVLGYDNLFSSADEPANRKAMDLLEKFAKELEVLDNPKIRFAEMFDVKIDISQKGQEKKNLLGFNKPGSTGTSILLKAMLNMTLLMIVRGKKQAANTRLVCPIDEMNKIEPANLDMLTEFASKAGMYMIGSGQNHTISALDYSYNVWNEKEDGVKEMKFISMDARNGKKSI